MSALHVAEHRLDAEPAAVRAARQAVEETLADIPRDELEGVLLATSEVVTNAIEHGAPPIELRVENGGTRVRVEVRDASPLRPRAPVAEPGPFEVRGRGMLIVDRCSDRWGIEPLAEGKAVWFEVDLG